MWGGFLKRVSRSSSFTSLPLVLKGVLTKEDAQTAAELGVAAVFVSNHGARQLDSAPASVRHYSDTLFGPLAKAYLLLFYIADTPFLGLPTVRSAPVAHVIILILFSTLLLFLRSRLCLRWWPQSRAGARCSWTAASPPARTPSRPSPSAPIW